MVYTEGKREVRSLLRSWPARSLRVLYVFLRNLTRAGFVLVSFHAGWNGKLFFFDVRGLISRVSADKKNGYFFRPFPRGTQKNERGTMTKISQLLRPTCLPPRAPRKAAPKGAAVAGEVARYHGRFCFCCAHALMCGFQYKCPPSPLAI